MEDCIEVDCSGLFVDVFERVAIQQSDAIAVASDAGSVTYRELDERANRLAWKICELCDDGEDPVAIYLNRSIDMIVAVIATLKAGRAFLPVPVDQPKCRSGFMLDDARPSLVVTDSNLRHLLPALDSPTVCMNELDVTKHDASGPQRWVTHQDAAYYIYTSGSSGEPKAVCVSHSGIESLRREQVAWLDIQPEDRILQFASLGFDAFVFELIMALGCGATLVLRRDDLSGLVDQLVDEGVTIATFPPSLIARFDFRPATSLRAVVSAGERCSPSALRHLPPNCLVINGYGPTETTVCATAYIAPPNFSLSELPIGRPLRGVELYLLDETLTPVPQGDVGEIYVSGACLARGYHRRPDLTADRFMPNPFGVDGSRMYRTGDLGRCLPSGEISFIGRIDSQVKIRGFRVELGEIEQALTDVEGVAMAAVMARAGRDGETRLVAYVETSNRLITEALIKDALAERLPSYMLPSAWALLKLPLNASGKVDRDSLPKVELSRPTSRANYGATGDKWQVLLSKVLTSVLGTEVSMEDSFVSSGGNSLDAVRVVNRLNSKFIERIPITAVLGATSLAELASDLSRLTPRDAEFVSHAVPQRDLRARGRYPATSAQLQVLYFSELHPNNNAYQAQSLTYLRGDLCRVALKESLSEIIERHEHFRTTYGADNRGDLWGTVHERSTDYLAEVDLSETDEGSRPHELLREVSRIAGQTIDPSALPLVKWVLFRISDQEHALLMLEHHYVHDGWSFRVFVAELAALYSAKVQQQAIRLPAPAQFAEFAEYEKAWLRSTDASSLKQSWQTYLDGCSGKLDLPFASNRTTQVGLRGRLLRKRLSVALERQITHLAAELELTSFQLFFGAFSILLARYLGEERFIIGTTVANRALEAWESVIGMLVNMVPVAVNHDPCRSARDGMVASQRCLATAIDLGELPFIEIVKASGLARDGERLQLVQVHFSAHNALEKLTSLPKLSLDIVEALPNGSSKFDLGVVCIPDVNEGTELLLEYSTDLFDEAAIERMWGHYVRLLEGIVSDPQQRIQDLPLLSDEERHQLLVDWNATQASFPDNQGIHELFEAQAEERPEAIAVEFGDEYLTYGQLNTRANQLAHRLLELGVKADTLVAVCVERSLEMVIGLLAILKAGGAYVPVDPNYPRERIKYILDDAKPVVALVHAHLRDRLGDVPAVCMDEEWDSIATGTTTNPLVPFHPLQLAYCIYTSGSTGTPKGVLVQHRSLLNFVTSFQQSIGVTQNDALVTVTPTTFDIFGLEIYLPLSTGARVVVADRVDSQDPAKLLSLIDRTKANVLQATPATWRLLKLQEGSLRLKAAICGGEALDGALADYVAGASCAAWNAYGPTETTIWSSKQELRLSAAPNIGQPISNTQIYILDESLNPVPVGVTGELYIAGMGLARGYLNRPALTAEKFVPNPFGPAGSRMYRTGDLGRYLADGNIEFLGRIDHQVKIRGFRIELGEVESTLLECQGVGEAVVLACDETGGGKRLVAYVVADPGATSITGTSLRRELAQRLPDYMLPSAWVFLDALPLSANGKIDRKALPAPEASRIDSGTEYVAPRNETERLLAGIWSEVLNLDQIGVHDNFFSLGGHSLLATRIVTKISAVFGVSPRLHDIFAFVTVAELSQQIQAAKAARSNAQHVIRRLPRSSRPTFNLSKE